MEKNISRYFNNSEDNQRLVAINYRTAQECEQAKDYKRAMHLYNVNIKRYNDSDSKVALAKLYLERKSGKIDNELARKLLEEAYMQENNKGADLLAYVWANGIGGKKCPKAAINLFFKELKNNNPDPMIYIELSELLPRNKKNKNIKKYLKASVSKYEIKKYKRKRNIDKFNNTAVGKVVNRVPNFFYTKLESFYNKRDKEKVSYGLGEVYDKAIELYDNENYEKARALFERLTNYGDKDASLKFAEMAYKGIGGEKDVYRAKSIYENILNEREYKLAKIDNEILSMKRKLNKIKNKAKITRRDKRYKDYLKEEIEYLKYRQDKIYLKDSYNDALLNYGLLLADNYQDKSELEAGVIYLKSFSDEGEIIPDKGAKLTKIGKAMNRRAKIAIQKLGWLYETNQWNPENLEEERNNFLKFSTGRIGAYTSYIADKMKPINETREIEVEEESREFIFENKKKCKFRYELGSLMSLLHINPLARRIFSSMSDKGDYRCSNLLANLEQRGKGGKKDIGSAIKHYREYIQSLNGNIDENIEKEKYEAVSDLAGAMLENEDIVGAITLYKISAGKGIKKAKKALKVLNQEGKWTPENEKEGQWIKQKVISKPTNIEEIKKPVIIQTVNRPSPVKSKFKQAVAASVAAATAISASGYAKRANSASKIPKISISEEQEIEVEENSNIEYTIGDSVLFKELNLECKIIGIVAYDSAHRDIFPTSDYNINNLGLTTNEYLDNLSAENKINKEKLDLLYCIKDSSGKIQWVDPKKQEIDILKAYRAVKKEEEVQDL